MKTSLAVAALVLTIGVGAVSAQDVAPPPAPDLLVPSQNQPQMGEYVVPYLPQGQAYAPLRSQVQEPTLVQQAAMQRAAERRARLESQAWYGVSRSRPTVPLTQFVEQANPYVGYPWFAHAPTYGPVVVYYPVR